jgi:translation initiation factor 2B subunit (eIF-2B alpha/beta/delta family)
MRMTSLNALVNYEGLKLTQTTSFRVSKVTTNSFSALENENDELVEYVENIFFNIENLISELEDISDNIQDQVGEHINDNDTILTANHSDQLEDFFKEASKFKSFNVIIAESAPSLK